MRKILSSHSAALGCVAAAAIALHLFVNVIVSPRVKDSTSVEYSVITFTELAFYLFIYLLPIAGVVLLLRRNLVLSRLLSQLLAPRHMHHVLLPRLLRTID